MSRAAGINGFLKLEVNTNSKAIQDLIKQDFSVIIESLSSNNTVTATSKTLRKRKERNAWIVTDTMLSMACNVAVRICIKDKLQRKYRTVDSGLFDIFQHWHQHEYETIDTTLVLRNKGEMKIKVSITDDRVGSLFECPIETVALPETYFIPQIVINCVNQVESNGMCEDGIYRISGNKNIIDDMKRKMNYGQHASLTKDKNGDELRIHNVTGVLKQYLKELPECLLTTASYLKFLAISNVEPGQSRNKAIATLLRDLPDANFYTFVFLINHLCKVASNEETNRMNPKAISTCFTPAMLYNKRYDSVDLTDQSELKEYTQESSKCCNIIEYMLDEWSDICSMPDITMLVEQLPDTSAIYNYTVEQGNMSGTNVMDGDYAYDTYTGNFDYYENSNSAASSVEQVSNLVSEQQLIEAQQTIDSLTHDNNQLEACVSDVQVDNNEWKKKFEELQHELEKVKNDSDMKNSQLESLNQSLASVKQDYSDLLNCHSLLQTELEKTKTATTVKVNASVTNPKIHNKKENAKPYSKLTNNNKSSTHQASVPVLEKARFFHDLIDKNKKEYEASKFGMKRNNNSEVNVV